MLEALALFALCPEFGPRITCVVDPDTVWIAGEKIRIANIDGPELNSPKCPYERELAWKATERLVTLLNSGEVALHRSGPDKDRYGRSLRSISVNGHDIGQQLVTEGLARPWTGKRQQWC